MANPCKLFIEDFLKLPSLALDNKCTTPDCEYGAIGQHPRCPVQQQAPVVPVDAEETAVYLQARANTTISASGLNSTDVLDFLALPYGPNCYHGHPLIDSLLQCVHDSSNDQYVVPELVSNLPYRFAHTFKKPKKPKENFCRINLYTILKLVLSFINNGNQHFSIRTGVDLQGLCDYFLAKATSQPEPSLVFDNGIWNCAVISGEAKTVDDGYHQAVAQGVSACADFAMDIADKGVPIHEILVPCILTLLALNLSNHRSKSTFTTYLQFRIEYNSIVIMLPLDILLPIFYPHHK
eukprot:gene37624-50796_t